MSFIEKLTDIYKSVTTNKTLRKKVIFTILMFFVARIGVHIAVPGLNMELFKGISDSSLGSFMNLFSGGAVEKASIFSLGIIPVINASIMFQLLGVIFPKIEEMQREGGKERDRVTQWQRYVAIIIAVFQSIGIVALLTSQNIVLEPGIMFTIRTVTLITGGTAFLMWLSERISINGIGRQGTSMLIFINIVAELPQKVFMIFKSIGSKAFGGSNIILKMIMDGKLLLMYTAIIFIGIIALMVIVQLADRRIPIQYVGKGREAGARNIVTEKTYLPLKINMSGVMPIIFSSMLMAVPQMLMGLVKNPKWNALLNNWFSPTGVGYLLLFALLIIMFSFFYIGLVFDPDKVSDNLKQSGAIVPTLRPGKETAAYLGGVASRLTFGSAIFLAVLGIFPNIWFGYALKMQPILQGTSLLILVGVAVETLKEIDSYAVSKNYKRFISK